MMEIERELDAALDVDPSPGFTARVRAEVSHMPAPRDRRLPIALAACCAAVVAAVLVATLVRTARQPGAPQPVPQEAAAPSVPAIDPPAVAEATPMTAAPPAAVRRAASRRTGPPVIIRGDEAKALRDLYVALSEGRVDVNATAGDYVVLGRGARDETLVELTAVELVPAMIDSEGVRQ